MATISSPGIGSGLDINGLVTKLMAVEQQPLTALATKEASFQAKLSAFGSMKGTLATLQLAAQTLANASTFGGMSAGVSDTTAFSVSADSTAAAGSYDIAVTSLAKNHIVSSAAGYDLADTFKGGTLDINIGSTAGVGGKTVTVTIPDGSTLAGVRDAINVASAGLSAAIVNDGTSTPPNRLVLTSGSTGSAGNIRITATQTGTGGTPVAPGVARDLTDFGYLGSDATMKQTRPADNAVFTVNGMAITRSTNTSTDVISGVTLNLLKEGGSAKLTVAKNTGTVQNAVSAFVKAYNDATSQMKAMTAYDAATKKASILTGDSTVLSIRSQLTAAIGSMVSGVAGNIGHLSDIGVTVQKDGTLAVDSAKLSAAVNDPAKDVKTLFASTTSGNKGIAVRLSELLNNVVGSTGMISSRNDGINASIKDIGNRRDALNLRLTVIEKRYRAQFTALDTLVASMQNTATYLTQQLASIASITSGK